MSRLRATLAANPLLRLPLYLGFAALFYYSGAAATVWLTTGQAPETAGQLALALVFPLLIPAFFLVNRYAGCGAGCGAAGGGCAVRSRRAFEEPRLGPPPG